MTEKQARVLRAVENWWAQHRRMPTLRELATVLGTKTRSSMLRHVRALVDAGHLVETGETITPANHCPTCGRPLKRR